LIRISIAFLGLGVAILKFRPMAGFLMLAIDVVLLRLGRAMGGRSRWLASRRALLVTVAITSLALVSLVLTLAGPSPRGLHP